jgi:uncharacterized protein YecE (DUF72 family)
MSAWRIGSMGFAYEDWRGNFYPKGTKPGDYLSFYAKHYNAVEIDSTFHAAPPVDRVKRWFDVVPADFRFCLKTPRAITHEGFIGDSIGPMRDFARVAQALGEKLSVVLVQYPPTLPVNVWPQVRRFLDEACREVRVAIEFRHASWTGRADVHDALRERNIALVNAEYEVDPIEPVATADFSYVRLIGVHGRFEPLTHERFDPTAKLQWWTQQLQQLPMAREKWVLLNNDWSGYSIATMDRLKRMIGEHVPAMHERQGMLF